MARGGKSGHVHPDLGNQSLGRATSYSGGMVERCRPSIWKGTRCSSMAAFRVSIASSRKSRWPRICLHKEHEPA